MLWMNKRVRPAEVNLPQNKVSRIPTNSIIYSTTSLEKLLWRWRKSIFRKYVINVNSNPILHNETGSQVVCKNI